MIFAEALKELENSKHMTRAEWKDNIWLCMIGNEIHTLQKRVVPYSYDNKTLIMNGWVVIGQESQTEYKLFEVIPYLKAGCKVKHCAWSKDVFIFFDNSSKCLAQNIFEEISFTLTIEDLLAPDWIEYNE